MRVHHRVCTPVCTPDYSLGKVHFIQVNQGRDVNKTMCTKGLNTWDNQQYTLWRR